MGGIPLPARRAGGALPWASQRSAFASDASLWPLRLARGCLWNRSKRSAGVVSISQMKVHDPVSHPCWISAHRSCTGTRQWTRWRRPSRVQCILQKPGPRLRATCARATISYRADTGAPRTLVCRTCSQIGSDEDVRRQPAEYHSGGKMRSRLRHQRIAFLRSGSPTCGRANRWLAAQTPLSDHLREVKPDLGIAVEPGIRDRGRRRSCLTPQRSS